MQRFILTVSSVPFPLCHQAWQVDSRGSGGGMSCCTLRVQYVGMTEEWSGMAIEASDWFLDFLESLILQGVDAPLKARPPRPLILVDFVIEKQQHHKIINIYRRTISACRIKGIVALSTLSLSTEVHESSAQGQRTSLASCSDGAWERLGRQQTMDF